MTLTPFDILYETRQLAPLFGENWVGPERLPHFAWTHIAHYNSGNSDGMDCDVYCSAVPTKFFKVVVHPSPNSVGEMRSGFTLRTGSSEGPLAAKIAEAIARGMLNLHPYQEDEL